MLSKLSLCPRWGLAIFLSAVLSVLGTYIPANAACANPSPIPTGFAAPCPVFSLSATTVSQAQTLTLSATPQPGTDYILTTAYISQGTNWNPYTLSGNNAAPSYSTSLASLTLSSTQLQALSLGTHYTVSWDWLWDATAQCYKGPGLNQCNTGQWRVQSFTITSTYAYSQSAYYTYSQSAYYAYSQSSYYTYSQSAYVSSPPIAFVQNCANSITGTGTSCAFTSSNTAGNAIVVMIGWENASGRAVTSLTDTRGNVYTAAAATCANASGTNRAVRIYYASNIPAGANTLTVTMTGTAGYTELFAQEYAGLDATSPLDKTACGTGASTSLTAGPVTTVTSNELLFAGAMDGTAVSAGSGFTFRSTLNDNFVEDRIGSVIGSYSAGATQAGADSYAMQLVTFKGSSGSSYTYSQSTYYAYSQSTYATYTYSQAAYTGGQPWSGIIAPSRATDWSGAGNAVINEARTKCGAMINAYNGTAATINNAIAACAGHGYVELGAGTFNLSSGIAFAGHNNVTLRGQGANSTLLVFSGAGAGFYDSVVSMEPTSLNEVNDAEQNICDWTAGYAKGTNVITLANCGTSTPAAGSLANLHVGSIIILDQLDEVTDNGQIWNCLVSTGEASSNNCSNNGTGPGGFQRSDGTTIACAGCTGGAMKWRSQQQGVLVTAINGNQITISPGLYMPNWRVGQKPQAWFGNTVLVGAGVENLSIAAGTPNGIGGTNTSGASRSIFIGQCDKCWVRGVRSQYANRSHVDILIATHFVVRDSYFFQNIDHGSVSYGVEVNSGFDGLVENNIFQQSTDGEPNCNGACAGNVFAYNFDVDNVWGSAGWMQAGFYAHASGDVFNLWEGNIGPGYTADDVHGTHHFETLFRNRLVGNQPAGCGSTGPATCTAQTNAVHAYAGSRYYNVIGNVLGQAGYHNTYSCEAAFGSGNGCANDITSVYRLGFTGSGGTNNNGFCLDTACSSRNRWDPQTPGYMMRWGNWDTVNNASRFLASEVPSGIGSYANPVPSGQDLPTSFYLGSKPAWFGSVPYPAIGPDVAGGNIANVGGHANMNPAMACYTNMMAGPADGSGSVRTFNAASCYP
jgi:hypothetical protein